MYGSNDCWAVFCKASEALFGVRVESVAVPKEPRLNEQIEIMRAATESPQWKRVDAPSPGAACLFRNRRGHATHIGLFIEGGRVLHCLGGSTFAGSTCLQPLADVLRLFKTVEYYEYDPDNN